MFQHPATEATQLALLYGGTTFGLSFAIGALVLGGTWIRNRMRMIPEPIDETDWRQAFLFFVVFSAVASVGVAVGAVALHTIVIAGYEWAIRALAIGVMLAAGAFVGVIKFHRAG